MELVVCMSRKLENCKFKLHKIGHKSQHLFSSAFWRTPKSVLRDVGIQLKWCSKKNGIWCVGMKTRKTYQHSGHSWIGFKFHIYFQVLLKDLKVANEGFGYNLRWCKNLICYVHVEREKISTFGAP